MNSKTCDQIFGFSSGFPQEGGPYEKVSINQLENAPMFPVLYGVVIGKWDSKFVATKKAGDRYVFNFTIRDSPSDVVNVSCWGDEGQVKSISDLFAIGDVVQIKNPQVVVREPGSYSEKFRPYTSSHHELIVSPRNSDITVCRSAETDEYKTFLHCSIYSQNYYLSVSDVVNNSENIEGCSVNLLVAIKKIGRVQILKAKDGRPLKKLEIEVFDQNDSSIAVLIWDGQTADFITKYFAPKSVMLISDVRINFSKYTNSLVATAASNTIFTPNPDISDARVLYQYAQTTSFEKDVASNSKGNCEPKIYTVEQVRQMLALGAISAFQDTEGIIYGFLSRFDIDSHARVISLRCPSCKHTVRSFDERCINGSCEVGSGMKVLKPENVFDIVVNITDHTGTLSGCSMFDIVAENMLNCTVPEFLKLSDVEKTVLKWQYLLENFKVEFKIPHATATLGKPIVRIMSCTRAIPDEVMVFYKSLL